MWTKYGMSADIFALQAVTFFYHFMNAPQHESLRVGVYRSIRTVALEHGVLIWRFHIVFAGVKCKVLMLVFARLFFSGQLRILKVKPSHFTRTELHSKIAHSSTLMRPHEGLVITRLVACMVNADARN